jgi:hypothetical protein
MKYYIRLVNDELPAPLYVERGLGFGGVKLTGSIREARRYDTEQEAEKIAALARAQKDKERGGECTTVEIVTEDNGETDGFETRVLFQLPASGAASTFQMKKTDAGIVSRYIDMNGAESREYGPAEMKQAVADWINCAGAWFVDKVAGRGAGK